MHSTPFAVALSVAVLAVVAVVGGGAGCAARPPPPELLDARAAYARARTTAKADPAEIAEAKRFLDAAERWQIDDPGSEETSNLAYIAHRKALLAEADARTAAAEVEQARELQALSVLRREQLADAHNRLEKSDDEATLATKPPGSRGAKEAVDRLSPFASVSESRAGMVVTIADSVLFERNSAKLMTTARERLDRVAQALVEVRGRSIAVKGFMDASGDDSHDTELSRRRADAVRQYLVTRGVAPERVRAIGLGTAQPIASNASAEGRQQNRRVEIVVEGMGQAAATH
jgi:outer membrane protein OmpA-like peptidoglycan-associated protein